MSELLESIRDMYEFKMAEAKTLYDGAEGVSAKVKLFLMFHKRTIVILAATHFAAIVLGVVIA